MSPISDSGPHQREAARVIRWQVSHRPFHRMMARQGIDLAGPWWRELEPHIFAALRRCRLCANELTCRRWLDSDRPRADYVRFCPNSGIIETCRILNPGAAPLKPEACEPPSCEPSLQELWNEPIFKRLGSIDRSEVLTRIP